MNIVSDKRRAAARKHARRAHQCSCGKVVFGNGGWSSHRRACRKNKESCPSGKGPAC